MDKLKLFKEILTCPQNRFSLNLTVLKQTVTIFILSPFKPYYALVTRSS